MNNENNKKVVEDTINAIRKNLAEIKKTAHISDDTLRDIFINTAPEELKEFLAEYNINHSESFEAFIQTNNRDYLITRIFSGIIS